MSKSAESDYTRINLTDDADLIAAKLKKAKTDPEPLPSEIEGLAERPEARNLVGIYAGLSDRSEAEVLQEFGGQGFGAFKPALAELAISVIAPISEKMNALLADEAQIDQILAEGADRARAMTRPILQDVKEIMGFVGR